MPRVRERTFFPSRAALEISTVAQQARNSAFFITALLPNLSAEHGQASAEKPDVWVWRVADAPAAIKKAFTAPVPEDGWVVKLAKTVVKDITIEASLLSLRVLPLLGRVQLANGEVALLFGPDASGPLPSSTTRKPPIEDFS
jgi:hypothetical protein